MRHSKGSPLTRPRVATLTPSAGVKLSSALREHTQAKIAAQLLDWSRSELALSVEEMSEILGASPRSVNRWLARDVPPSGEYSDRIGKLGELRYLLDSVFQDQTSRIGWMHSPLPLLKGRTPLGALRKGGWDEVLGVLAGLESGAFA